MNSETAGDAEEPPREQPESLQAYKDQLDRRHYSLNAAQVLLTKLIQDVWVGEAEEEKLRLRLHADRQYLKVVVEDELGVEVELDQRSAGFQWLVSFFIVFRAQAEDEYQNAILLLDEPGLSLHALKQRQFRHTVSKIAETNQTLYTTHSPFMVGPSELPIVRVVEMTARDIGTKVHTHVTAILYIGKTSKNHFRIGDLIKSLSPHHKSLGHHAGIRFSNNIKLRERFPFERLYFTFIPAENPKEKESQELQEYFQKYGEVPPLNATES